jgi:hypothetical protein
MRPIELTHFPPPQCLTCRRDTPSVLCKRITTYWGSGTGSFTRYQHKDLGVPGEAKYQYADLILGINGRLTCRQSRESDRSPNAVYVTPAQHAVIPYIVRSHLGGIDKVPSPTLIQLGIEPGVSRPSSDWHICQWQKFDQRNIRDGRKRRDRFRSSRFSHAGCHEAVGSLS